MNQPENFSEVDSLKLITEMINKTKQSFHDTGFGPIMWGSVVTFCALVSFCSYQFNFKLPFDIWLLVFVAIVPQVIYSFNESKRKKVKTYNDIALDFTWIAFGITMFVIGFAINFLVKDYSSIPNIVTVRGDFRLSNHFTAFYLMIYAIPTFITGGIMKFKPMIWGGVLCWVLAIVSCFTDSKLDMLFTAIAATCAWLIPGLLINKHSRERNKANV
jgi:hypothetical protein